MGQITRCPLTGDPCSKPIKLEEKTFFLAEVEKPEDVRNRRIKAVTEAIGDGFKIRSALDEKGINAFTCKICEMIQLCAYGMADITDDNPNVLFELGIMIALGKPTIILKRIGQETKLNLPSDLHAIEIIPFTEYIDIIDPLRKVIVKLPSPALLPSPLEDIERVQPQIAQELKNIGAGVIKEFKESLLQAKLDTVSVREEKIEIPPSLSETIRNLEEKLDDILKLGFVTDAKTAFLRGNYYHNQGKYNDALASYNWCLELKPNDANALNNRGNTYRRLGKNEEAFSDYNKSLELKPDNPDTLNNRGITYSTLGKYEEALPDFNRSLQLRPDNPGTLYNLACLFSLQRKESEALTYLKKAIDKDKKYREMAKTDKDFDNIRGTPHFEKLIEPE